MANWLSNVMNSFRDTGRYGRMGEDLTEEELAALSEYERMERARQERERGSRLIDAGMGIAAAIRPSQSGPEVIAERQAQRDREFADQVRRQQTAQDRTAAAEDRARQQQREDFEFTRAQTEAEREDAEFQRRQDERSFWTDPNSSGSQMIRRRLAEIFPDGGFEDMNAEQMGAVMENPAIQMYMDEMMADREFARDLALERAKQASKTTTPTTFQKEVEKDYAEFLDAGGSAAVDTDIKKLDAVIEYLESGDRNRYLALLPETARAYVDERGLDAEQAVASVTQKNLRQILGGQFAQREGEQLVRRGYDPNASDEVNLRRVRELRNMMQTALQNRKNTFQQAGLMTPEQQDSPTPERTVVRRSTQPDGTVIVQYSDGTYGTE